MMLHKIRNVLFFEQQHCFTCNQFNGGKLESGSQTPAAPP